MKAISWIAARRSADGHVLRPPRWHAWLDVDESSDAPFEVFSFSDGATSLWGLK